MLRRDNNASRQYYSLSSKVAASQSQIDVEYVVSDFFNDIHASPLRRSQALLRLLRKEQKQRRQRNWRKRIIRRLLWSVLVLGVTTVDYTRQEYVHGIMKRLMMMNTRIEDEHTVMKDIREKDNNDVAEVVVGANSDYDMIRNMDEKESSELLIDGEASALNENVNSHLLVLKTFLDRLDNDDDDDDIRVSHMVETIHNDKANDEPLLDQLDIAAAIAASDGGKLHTFDITHNDGNDNKNVTECIEKLQQGPQDLNLAFFAMI
eukprot:CAMPEP_0172480180 /NCGR_PEP_ID=MMETSP1066-20121228/5196_1 /TAXON_ID=671091 /ORGANISM="Coscinodiscus wailesii, Strain CCMP2513" /LENGTH=262 /DNA_ID=CAMNT_0013241285 /DNA_START=73 /DNA_END=861 /DNA_ORIENTATION=+